MLKPRFQFSLAALLLTVAAVAGVLALMLRVPGEPAFVSMSIIVIVLTALALTGLSGRRPGMRAFCIGALVPLGILLFSVAQSLHWFAYWFAIVFSLPPNPYGQASASLIADGVFAKFFGVGILSSIALGYLCVGFRRLIERRETPEG